MGEADDWPAGPPGCFETTLAALFDAAVGREPDRIWLSFEGEDFTLARTARHVHALTHTLRRAGLRPGDRVATRIDPHPGHVAAILALARLGAVWVPLDPKAPAAALAPRVALAAPAAGIADPHHGEALRAAGLRGPVLPASADADADDRPPAPPDPSSAPSPRRPDDHRAILFTSGTTGAPKGVIVTERMLCAAGRFAARAGRAGPDETFLLWEPLNHIGGAQMIPAALVTGARLAMVRGFSASRFWRQAKAAGATRIHYLGGVLDLLARQPPGPRDRDHGVTLGFGAAARPPMWSLFRERFGVALTEVYGQTEAASFCVMNPEGVAGAIGRPLPQFTVALRGADGTVRAAGAGEGEILLRADPPGLLSPGYLDNEAATRAAFRDGWFHTGDLAARDADGLLRFRGRAGEAMRVRGENVSALEVETAIAAHPAVEECAVIGVPAEIGEEEILAVVTLAAPPLDPAGLLAFLAPRLAAYQLPRYVRVVEAFPRTPSERIAKPQMSRDVSRDWDARAVG